MYLNITYKLFNFPQKNLNNKAKIQMNCSIDTRYSKNTKMVDNLKAVAKTKEFLIKEIECCFVTASI